MSNKLTKMAREILEIEGDLPHRLDYSKKPYPSIDDYTMYTFEEAWGSTALGFGGIGGQAITVANTYVFIPENTTIETKTCFVYFAGGFAYSVEYSEEFMEDVRKQRVASVAIASKYIKG